MSGLMPPSVSTRKASGTVMSRSGHGILAQTFVCNLVTPEEHRAKNKGKMQTNKKAVAKTKDQEKDGSPRPDGGNKSLFCKEGDCLHYETNSVGRILLIDCYEYIRGNQPAVTVNHCGTEQ